MTHILKSTQIKHKEKVLNLDFDDERTKNLKEQIRLVSPEIPLDDIDDAIEVARKEKREALKILEKYSDEFLMHNLAAILIVVKSLEKSIIEGKSIEDVFSYISLLVSMFKGISGEDSDEDNS